VTDAIRSGGSSISTSWSVHWLIDITRVGSAGSDRGGISAGAGGGALPAETGSAMAAIASRMPARRITA